MRDVLVGTAGHIDHGKTTLVKALTGIDADRLQEEKRRGITIDIGFAWMELDGFRVGFVDVPGHEKFVKNMLAGIGGIQFVLLVVAADESIMPQTVEHFRICQLLEIPKGMVVLTKTALAEPDLIELVREEVSDMAAGTFLEGAPIVSVDSLSGSGIEELKTTLLAELEQIPALRTERRIFRMPIDRVFSSRGFGTIVTGTPMAGTLEKNDSLQAYPSEKSGKVRSIQVFGEEEAVARAGQRTALNLAGLERSLLERGMILAPPGSFHPSQILDVSLRIVPDAPAPVAHRDPVRLHHGSGETMGRIYLFDQAKLLPGERGLAQIRLDQPIQVCCLDHFVLRRYSPMTTIAGGVILDNRAPKHRRKDLKTLLPQLKALERTWLDRDADPERILIEYLVTRAGARGVSVDDLTSRTGLRKEVVLGHLSESEIPRFATPDLAVSGKTLDDLQQRTLRFLEDFHSEHPLQIGMPQEELKNRVMPRVSSLLAQHVLERMVQSDSIVVQEGLVRRADWEVELTSRQQEIRTAILKTFDPQTLATPDLEEIQSRVDFPKIETDAIYFYLIQSGELIRVSGEIVLSREQLDWMLSRVQGAFDSGDRFGVAEFKKLFDISRKFAIPYLEFLDRQKVTRRVGDQRVVL